LPVVMFSRGYCRLESNHGDGRTEQVIHEYTAVDPVHAWLVVHGDGAEDLSCAGENKRFSLYLEKGSETNAFKMAQTFTNDIRGHASTNLHTQPVMCIAPVKRSCNDGVCAWRQETLTVFELVGVGVAGGNPQGEGERPADACCSSHDLGHTENRGVSE